MAQATSSDHKSSEKQDTSSGVPPLSDKDPNVSASVREKGRPAHQPRPMTEIGHGLYCGDICSLRCPQNIERNGITAIVSLRVERQGFWDRQLFRGIMPAEKHWYIACADTMTQDLLPHLDSVCDFIDSQKRFGNVLIHCDRGISRSATVVIASLMRSCGMSFDDTLDLVNAKRRVKPNPNFVEQLKVWEAVGYQIWQDSDKKIPKPEYAAYLAHRAERL